VTEVPASLAPDRQTDGALSRLVDVLLDKGVYLDLDLVVTVAEVPLIAVHLRAMIAGVETMIEHGVPGPWAVPGDAHPGDVRQAAPEQDDALLRSPASSAELLEHGPVWREGTLVLDAHGTMRWQGEGDRRPSFVLDTSRIAALELEDTSPDGRRVLEIRSGAGTARFALEEAAEWAALLGGHGARPGAERGPA
jgi:hypothetical protein